MRLTSLLLGAIPTVLSVVNGQLLTFTPGESEYKLAEEGFVPAIKVSGDDFVGVHRTAQDLADDFGRVIGTNGTVSIVNGTTFRHCSARPVIIAGTIGHSSLVDELISNGKLDVSEIEGEWESYTSQVVKDPAENVPWALVVAGSDRRGTIYGLYDISETMGVSPWYWWADVPIDTKTDIWVLEAGKIQGTPSIKYRGFFINDEQPALGGWVNENTGGFVGDFYRLVFELCLRLKGNYIWPAMWGRMFYVEDPENGQIADDYGVIMGTSHHEPIARSEREQQLYNQGNWDWGENGDNITEFWEAGIERARDWDTMWTMGMRGSGDEASPTLTAEQLEQIIKVQQELLQQGLDIEDVYDIPTTWVLYKEVSQYYVRGLEVPDSVTLLWTDDNSGNILRVPIANETDRVAGAGVYYHFDYVGAPRSYKWINTIQLVKTWEQMHLAYEKNARRIWIANVGDLKPLEIPLTHFMDMAYDMDKYTTPESTTEWLKRWATREFGASVADETADILNEYGILVGRRKYELLSNLPFAFSTTNYDEAERNLAQWEALLEKTQNLYDGLDDATQISYFQLILHPIMAGKTVVDLYTKVALGKLYSQQGRVSTNLLGHAAHGLFVEDEVIEDQYHSLNGGKWNHFVNQVHLGYTSWNDPPNNTNIMPVVSWTSADNATDEEGILGVSGQGDMPSYPTAEDDTFTLLAVDPYLPSEEIRYLDVFARNNGTVLYSITANASFVSVTNAGGTLTAPGDRSDARAIITVDWDEAPEGLSWVALDVSSSEGRGATALLPVKKTSVPQDFEGYIESGGVVSVEAAHFAEAETGDGLSYIEIPHYGRTLSGVKLWPPTAGSQSPGSGPALEYSVLTTTDATNARAVVMLGTSLNHDPTRPLRFAVSIDGSEPQVVQPVPDTPMYLEPPPWYEAIIGGGWTSTVSLGEVSAGEHELNIWLLEPGVILQKVVLDVGGFRTSALGPPESRSV